MGIYVILSSQKSELLAFLWHTPFAGIAPIGCDRLQERAIEKKRLPIGKKSDIL
jgi:hypothetical protein